MAENSSTIGNGNRALRAGAMIKSRSMRTSASEFDRYDKLRKIASGCNHQRSVMELVHLFAAASVVLALVLLFAGASGAASLVFGLGCLIEVIGAAVTGKQSNDRAS